jgi:hypothetical protein
MYRLQKFTHPFCCPRLKSGAILTGIILLSMFRIIIFVMGNFQLMYGLQNNFLMTTETNIFWECIFWTKLHQRAKLENQIVNVIKHLWIHYISNDFSVIIGWKAISSNSCNCTYLCCLGILLMTIFHTTLMYIQLNNP